MVCKVHTVVVVIREIEAHSDFNCVEFLQEPTLYTVKGMAILDNDGNRILAKYYDRNVFPTAKEQKAFEKNLFSKTHRANAEIIMLDGLTCVYRSNVDLFFYVMGSSHENELILMSVLNCLYDSVSHILRKNVEKRVVLENLDIVMLAMDEICDGGIIMEADSSAVVQRVALRPDDLPLGEQTVAQGSLLLPFLFIIVMEAVVFKVVRNMKAMVFADDLRLWFGVKKKRRYRYSCMCGVRKWKLRARSKVMVIRRKRGMTRRGIQLYGVDLEQVKNFRYHSSVLERKGKRCYGEGII
ncbi:hypothetical protein PR048_028586 [Dryococelus australis]|uniref:Coatomer subunit zeta n=1 Tax=Dryococelus australis TaxID=614101 RepID=A0ABQ9GES1_9NEOP|nr:hypothetical protein PR048_028586 [Dryococelus australis]